MGRSTQRGHSMSKWGMSYEAWENIANIATAETVREAAAYEAAGWPWPISGDLLAVQCLEVRRAAQSRASND